MAENQNEQTEPITCKVTGSGRYLKAEWSDGYKLSYDWPRALWHMWNPKNFDAPNLYATTMADLVFSFTSYAIAAIATDVFPEPCMLVVAASIPEHLMNLAVEEDVLFGRRIGPQEPKSQLQKAVDDFKKGTHDADV